MNDVFETFISLSFSGSLVILILFLCKHFWKDKISRQWQYYIWIIALARLLLPFAPETNLTSSIFQAADRVIFQSVSVPLPHEQDNPPDMMNVSAPDMEQNGQEASNPPIHSNGQPLQDILTLFAQNIWLIWLVTALVLLIRKITIYHGFVHYVKAGQILVSDVKLLDRLSVLAEQAGIKRPVELCCQERVFRKRTSGIPYCMN